MKAELTALEPHATFVCACGEIVEECRCPEASEWDLAEMRADREYDCLKDEGAL